MENYITDQIVGTIWTVSAIVSHGINFAYFQRKYVILAAEQLKTDFKYSILISVLGGPIAMIVTLSMFKLKYRMKFLPRLDKDWAYNYYRYLIEQINLPPNYAWKKTYKEAAKYDMIFDEPRPK